MRKLLFLLLFISVTFDANAGGRGGHNTTFDSNLYGGGWACFRALASGTCGGATAQYFDAACNGIADDQPAVDSLITYAAGTTSLIKLYIPPGSNCRFSGVFKFVGSFGVASGPKNVLLWAYGSTLDGAIFGGWGFYQDGVHEGLIQNVIAGDTAVTLKTGSDAARFSVGDWVCVNGLGLQHGGFPPNQQYLEYRVITAINGSVISLSGSLRFDYKSNWPIADLLPTQGPAIISKMQPTWDINIQVFGATLVSSSFQNLFQGRTVISTDIQVRGQNTGIAPTTGDSLWFFNSQLLSVETDKLINNIYYYNSAASRIATQSTSVVNLTLWGWSGDFITGLAQNNYIYNTRAGFVLMGPTGFGHGVSAFFDGSTIVGASMVNHFIDVTWVTYSGGTFSIANADPNYYNAISAAVPGGLYGFSSHVDFSSVKPDSNPLTTFTITAVRDDGTNTHFDTNIVGALPTPLCGVSSCPYYMAYPAGGAGSIRQINKPAASFDMTQFNGP